MNNSAYILDLWGYSLNLMTVLILGMIIVFFYLLWQIQTSKRLDFADMFTKDGRKVSSTKVLQFIGGMAATWVIIKMALQGNLSSEILGIYLAYVASIEGFSKFISAKYNYSETSVKDAESTSGVNTDGPIEAVVKETTTADGEKIIEQKIKKG